MAKSQKEIRPKARLPKGMRDIGADEIRAMDQMIGTIRRVYESYGFEPLETPAFEYTDSLGKFLPDQDRPNEGVFSFQDEDEQWLSLRYDLTAPLARFVAENYDALAKPYRRYQTGPVWRNEKPGPGRFRQFTQFDADTVGTDNPAADAEICMLAADTMEALGIGRGQYVVRVNNRKVLDGAMQFLGLSGDENAGRRLTVLRAIDKYDRLGADGVRLLLGTGRRDESGDFTPGAGLNQDQISALMLLFSTEAGAAQNAAAQSATAALKGLDSLLQLWQREPMLAEGIGELKAIAQLVGEAGYEPDRIRIDTSVVRGLEYYTGPVFEAELTFEHTDEDGRPIRFGSVGGGGRYDGLVARFKGTTIPATGFSIGVSRLYSALQALGKAGASEAPGPVVVLVMDRERTGAYQLMARQLREAGIRAEIYLGTSGMKAQMKYADKRAAPCVVIQGEDERQRGEVTIKDLIEGSRLSGGIADHTEWREGRPAQFSVAESELVEAVESVLARHRPQS